MCRERIPGHKLQELSGPVIGGDFGIGIDLQTEIVTETEIVLMTMVWMGFS